MELDHNHRRQRWCGAATFIGMDWQTVIAIGALALGGRVIARLLRRQIICAVWDTRRVIER